ncbi:MAG: hypothetical protein SFX18_05290 [Pirellulales bacterium]|nr:hypothetical protein [Pirellulales bacterium]
MRPNRKKHPAANVKSIQRTPREIWRRNHARTRGAGQEWLPPE